MTSATLSSAMLSHAKTLYAEQKNPSSGFDDFLTHLTSHESNAQESETLDASHPISHYFISSSHNTYLSGNQLYGKASTAPYQHVLERGCRCVEIDVWDGEAPSSSDEEGPKEDGRVKKMRQRLSKELRVLKGKKDEHATDTRIAEASDRPDSKHDNIERIKAWHAVGRVEPRVLHGYTATKEVSFRSVCETIARYAFKTSDLPLIASLEIHTSPEQQEIMVEIMRETWGEYLLDRSFTVEDTRPLPSLDSLRKTILIKVKTAASTNPKSKAAKSEVSETADSSDDEQLAESVKKGKIIPSLGSMGVFTRSCHFKSFDQPEASIPTHIFALSEKKLTSIYERDPNALFNHNKNFLMRAYPKGVRVSSSNLDPTPLWRNGVQMVALNWQYINASIMLNQAMFANTGGWVLKPASHRAAATETQPPRIQRGALSISIEILAGQNLCREGKKLHPYIRCELHIDQAREYLKYQDVHSLEAGVQSKDGEIKASTEKAVGGRDADFRGQVLSFKDIPGISEDLTFIRFKVMDDDSFGRDDMVAWACFRLTRFREGVRMIHLFDKDGQATSGLLLVRTSKTFVPYGTAAH